MLIEPVRKLVAVEQIIIHKQPCDETGEGWKFDLAGLFIPYNNNKNNKYCFDTLSMRDEFIQAGFENLNIEYWNLTDVTC